MIERYKMMYDIVQLLTVGSSSWVYEPGLYCTRALVLAEMREYQLAWDDCMRFMGLIEYQSITKPPRYDVH